MTDVRTGARTARDTRGIDDLRGRVRGEVIDPESAEYDAARRIYNAMIDRRPALIVRCQDVADVMAALKYAVDHDLPVAIRGGAHHVAGFSVCDDGVMIDLSPMKGIRYDTEHKRVRVGGGCTWGDVDHALHAFGRAVPGGIISTTGVGGLTLGGGIGHLTRLGGLSCDNLLSADVVTAQGEFVTASEKENKDLFWALRGGGGNFGVVTSFEFRTHPVHTVYAGPILWPLDKARNVMRFYDDYLADAPNEMNGFFAYLIVPPAPMFPTELHNKTMCGVVACYAGDIEDAEKVVRPLREYNSPTLAMVGPMPFPALQSAFDGLVPFGNQNYWKAEFTGRLSDELAEAHHRHGPQIPTVSSAVHIYPVSGAAHKVDKDETAYYYRDAEYAHVIAAMYPDPADTEKNREWVRGYWDDISQFTSGGAYVNMIMDEGEARVATSYRDNLPRLREIKAKYDPQNRFRMNQNIAPRK